MWCRYRNRGQRGFTVPEALVALILVVIVLVVGAQLLFGARRAAERQRRQVDARQAARAAVEYIHFLLRGATDMNGGNRQGPSPFAILTFARFNNAPVSVSQVSYDNLTPAQAQAQFGDVGTDIITFARAEDATAVPIACWAGGTSGNAANLYFSFAQGCPNSADNLQRFKSLTGAHIEGNREVSEIFVVYDELGQATLMKITDYNDGNNGNNCTQAPSVGGCSLTPPAIHVIANPGASGFVNPPGGFHTLTCGGANRCWGAVGVRFYSLRVWKGRLQQKRGVFDPYNPNQGFLDVLPSVEDFQVAYFFRNGAVWNNLPGNSQVPPMGPNPWEPGFDPLAEVAQNVVAIRITVTGRSTEPMPITEEPGLRFVRPAAENRLAGTTADRFYRYQSSAFVLIRSRAPQA